VTLDLQDDVQSVRESHNEVRLIRVRGTQEIVRDRESEMVVAHITVHGRAAFDRHRGLSLPARVLHNPVYGASRGCHNRARRQKVDGRGASNGTIAVENGQEWWLPLGAVRLDVREEPLDDEAGVLLNA